MSEMPADIKRTILLALEHARDDSLERAEWSFKGLPPHMMQEQYGASGQTRQEILNGYRAARRANDLATQWVRQQ